MTGFIYDATMIGMKKLRNLRSYCLIGEAAMDDERIQEIVEIVLFLFFTAIAGVIILALLGPPIENVFSNVGFQSICPGFSVAKCEALAEDVTRAYWEALANDDCEKAMTLIEPSWREINPFCTPNSTYKVHSVRIDRMSFPDERLRLIKKNYR
jgi:hypothetical protein